MLIPFDHRLGARLIRFSKVVMALLFYTGDGGLGVLWQKLSFNLHMRLSLEKKGGLSTSLSTSLSHRPKLLRALLHVACGPELPPWQPLP